MFLKLLFQKIVMVGFSIFALLALFIISLEFIAASFAAILFKGSYYLANKIGVIRKWYGYKKAHGIAPAK